MTLLADIEINYDEKLMQGFLVPLGSYQTGNNLSCHIYFFLKGHKYKSRN